MATKKRIDNYIKVPVTPEERATLKNMVAGGKAKGLSAALRTLAFDRRETRATLTEVMTISEVIFSLHQEILSFLRNPPSSLDMYESDLLKIDANVLEIGDQVRTLIDVLLREGDHHGNLIHDPHKD